jgi:2'-5' RNA ligase
MPSGSGDGVPINCFALVAYIPEPLSSFLDDLRRELSPGSLPRAHVTILPPRPLAVRTSEAIAEISKAISRMVAFEIEVCSVEIFQATSVIYISLGGGRGELQRIHDVLNTGALEFSEPFSYWPHLTLAQDLKPEQVAPVQALAKKRWDDYRGSRSIPIETLSFVQSTETGRWLDLAHWTLEPVPSVRWREAVPDPDTGLKPC